MAMADNLKGMEELEPLRDDRCVFYHPEFYGINVTEEIQSPAAYYVKDSAGAIVPTNLVKFAKATINAVNTTSLIKIIDVSKHGTQVATKIDKGVLVIKFLKACGLYLDLTNDTVISSFDAGAVFVLPVTLGVAVTSTYQYDLGLISSSAGDAAEVYLFATAIDNNASDAFDTVT